MTRVFDSMLEAIFEADNCRWVGERFLLSVVGLSAREEPEVGENDDNEREKHRGDGLRSVGGGSGGAPETLNESLEYTSAPRRLSSALSLRPVAVSWTGFEPEMAVKVVDCMVCTSVAEYPSPVFGR